MKLTENILKQMIEQQIKEYQDSLAVDVVNDVVDYYQNEYGKGASSEANKKTISRPALAQKVKNVAQEAGCTKIDMCIRSSEAKLEKKGFTIL